MNIDFHSFVAAARQQAEAHLNDLATKHPQLAEVWPSLSDDVRESFRQDAVEHALAECLLPILNEIRATTGLPAFAESECSWDNCAECEHQKHGTCTANLPWPNGTPPEPPCFEFSDKVIRAREHADEMRTMYGNKDIRTVFAISEAMAVLPPFLKRKVDARMAEAGFIKPKPCGYSDDGEPLFNLDDVAAMVGVSEDEAIEHARNMDDELAAHGITPQTHTGNIHAVQ